MKHIVSLSLLILSVFLLTACGSGSDQQTSTGAYLGGTSGVLAVFEPFGVEENGVYSVYDTEAFPIEVTVQNKGEYDVKPGDVTIRLLGPAPTEFSGIATRELKNQQAIDKISELVPEGGEQTLTFATAAKYNNQVVGVINRDWFVNLEYKYQTYVIVPEVCLKEDLTDERVCTVRENKNFFVSGAPLTVTAVEEDTAGKGIMALRLKIRNVGGGDITKVSEEFGVNDQLTYTLDDPAWECKSAGRIGEARLQNNEAEILCKLKEPLQKDDLYTKQVQLTFDYKYRDIVPETLRIKQSVK